MRSPQGVLHAGGVKSESLGIGHAIVGKAVGHLADAVCETCLDAVEDLDGCRVSGMKEALEGAVVRTAPTQTR